MKDMCLLVITKYQYECGDDGPQEEEIVKCHDSEECELWGEYEKKYKDTAIIFGLCDRCESNSQHGKRCFVEDSDSERNVKRKI